MRSTLFLVSWLVLPTAVGAQTPERDSTQDSVIAEHLRNWKPMRDEFRLYVNTDGNAADTVPKIDVLSDKGSSPFFMKRGETDTIYLYVIPPDVKLEQRSVIDRLPGEFPLVILAGTERATYWFSYEAGTFDIEPLTPKPFISLVPLQKMPDNVVCWQLQGSGNSAKAVKAILKALGDQVQLTQLKPGFYEGSWFYIRTTVVRTWNVNETSAGTLLALQVSDPAMRSTVEQQLRELKITK